jgi:AraC family transcriptional regulator, regulatory protein of adaptative response / methylated-DNA-[protein]-cysteine methyltransferase
MSDVIRYAFGKMSLGDVMVAASGRGVAALKFVDDRGVAAKLGTRDARDVTVAISTNPITVLVPCHRALKKNGSISGYRWPARRKRVLLEPERLALRGRK